MIGKDATQKNWKSFNATMKKNLDIHFSNSWKLRFIIPKMWLNPVNNLMIFSDQSLKRSLWTRIIGLKNVSRLQRWKQLQKKVNAFLNNSIESSPSIVRKPFKIIKIQLNLSFQSYDFFMKRDKA